MTELLTSTVPGTWPQRLWRACAEGRESSNSAHHDADSLSVVYDARYDKRPENHLAAVVKLAATNLNGAISKEHRKFESGRRLCQYGRLSAPYPKCG